MTKVVGVVLRAKDTARSAAFYRALGLELTEHRHGGPTHFEMGPNDPSVVVELYQASDTFPHDALMLSVPNLTKALAICFCCNVFPATEITTTSSMTFVYVRDPDDRLLMLIQQ